MILITSHLGRVRDILAILASLTTSSESPISALVKPLYIHTV